MFRSLQDPLALLGRILMSILFLVAGWGKITAYQGTAGYMASKGMPLIEVLLPLTILVEFGGGLLLLLGWRTREVAAVLFLFLIPVTVIFHATPDEQVQMLKNLAIMGGMLMVMAFGPGRYSLDGKGGRA